MVGGEVWSLAGTLGTKALKSREQIRGWTLLKAFRTWLIQLSSPCQECEGPGVDCEGQLETEGL